MSTVVLRCADAPVPIALANETAAAVSARPTADEIDELLPVLDVDSLPRIIVLGDDAALAAVLTHLMRVERLDVPLGFVPPERTHGSRCYHTGSGSVAAKRLLRGAPQETPLIRDDTGTALIGRAVVTGPDDEKIEGEAYVDETLLFRGKAVELQIAANVSGPGLSARVRTGIRKHPWVEGRAVQLGTSGAVVSRNGTTGDRVLKRVSFYRHDKPWLLIR